MNIEEGNFWKEVVCSLCLFYDVEPNWFLSKIKPLKETWQIEYPLLVLSQIEKVQNKKVEYINNEISNILSTEIKISKRSRRS